MSATLADRHSMGREEARNSYSSRYQVAVTCSSWFNDCLRLLLGDYGLVFISHNLTSTDVRAIVVHSTVDLTRAAEFKLGPRPPAAP